MTRYSMQSNDIPVMVESLSELFQETDDVSPKLLAARMSQKAGREISYFLASYLAREMGFCSKRGTKKKTRALTFLIPDKTLLEELTQRYCGALRFKTRAV